MAVQVAGSINVDLIQSVEALPRPGETVLSFRSARLPGGKGANQAVAAARMGAPTRMIGAVGSDDGGSWMRGMLEEHGVDTQAIAALKDMATGLASIAVDCSGENQIIVNPGANEAVTPDQAAQIRPEAQVLLAQLEIPVDTVRAFFTAPAAQGRIRILNAAPALREAAPLFDHADILIVNQHELAHYLGLSDAPQSAEDALVARQLIARGDQAVIVTLGALGAVAVWNDRHFHAPALSVTPIDTIGAGDCFCGALAALLDSGESVEAALPLANAAAALCTQKQGAIPAMPSRSEAENALELGTAPAAPN
ncbi:ribokinase [Altererythrobacter fulvus]|uniref:ribokinase n=1 Tax=Caenibius fulvus TaxID=2126012 RepID=UPI003018CBCD